MASAGVTDMLGGGSEHVRQWGGGSSAGANSRSFSSSPLESEDSTHAFSSGALGSDAQDGAADAAEQSALDPQAIADACGAAELDALAAAGELAWLPTRGLQNLLGHVHLDFDLPWVATIAATTAAVRTLMLPVVVYQMRNTARMSAARPEMEVLMKWLKERQSTAGDRPESMQAIQQEYWQRINEIWKKHDCNPAKSLISLGLQAPTFLCFFAGLRHLAAAKVPSMMDGGALWFTDLTVADPTYALPILSSLTFLATVELGAADGMQGQPPETLRKMKMAMRALAVIIVPVTMTMPAGVFVYWCTSNLFSLVQTAVLKVRGLRTVLGLPELSVKPASAASSQPAQTFASRPQPRAQASAAASAARATPQTYDVQPLPASGAGKAKQQRGRGRKGR